MQASDIPLGHRWHFKVAVAGSTVCLKGVRVDEWNILATRILEGGKVRPYLFGVWQTKYLAKTENHSAEECPS